jgi:hypothetical protein
MNELRARTKRFAAGFISKLSIALEEIDETAFWLEFLPDTRLGSSESVTPLCARQTSCRPFLCLRAKPRGQTRKKIAPMIANACWVHRAFSAFPAFLLQLHEQDIVGQSDSLFNGWAVALLKRNFVRHRMTKRRLTFVDS